MCSDKSAMYQSEEGLTSHRRIENHRIKHCKWPSQVYLVGREQGLVILTNVLNCLKRRYGFGEWLPTTSKFQVQLGKKKKPFVWKMQINIWFINLPFICPHAEHTTLWILFVFICRSAHRKYCFYHVIFGVLEIPMTVISCGELIKWMLIMIQLPK